MIRFAMQHRYNRPLGLSLIATVLTLAGCSNDDTVNPVPEEGGVFVMSNILEANTIVAYQRASNGTLTLAGEFATGGQGGTFDDGEGLDPLVSAYSLLNTPDNKYLMAVNAGSDTVSVMRVNADMTLDLVDTENTDGDGPNSIAYSNGYVYVTNIDAEGAVPGGSITGYRFANGDLTPLENSTRNLPSRPAGIRVSPDGEHLIITSVNAGSAGLASNNDALTVFGLDDNGMPTESSISGASSTEAGNAENRNLATSIGLEVVNRSDRTFVIATEAREFGSQGQDPVFEDLQTGSVSVFELSEGGALSALQLDVLAGQSAEVGQRTSCWIVMSPDGDNFWVANALDSTISSYRFTDASGNIELLQEVAAAGAQPAGSEPAEAIATTDGFIDLDITDSGKYIYQLYGLSGAVGVYAVDGGNLTLVEEVGGDLPERDTQGLVAF